MRLIFSIMTLLFVVCVSICISNVCAADGDTTGNAAAPGRVLMFDITLPITPGVASSLRREIENALTSEDTVSERQTMMIFRMIVPPGQENFGRGSSFGGSYELADLISGSKMSRVRSVAFFPQSVQGHALLVGLACDEIYLAAQAQIGEAAVDETQLTPTIRQAYLEISARRSKVPEAVINKMLDPAAGLAQVETEKGTRWFEMKEIARLKEKETFVGEPVILKPAGHPGFFTADEARRIGLVTALADNMIVLSQLLQIVPEQIRVVRVTNSAGHAVRIDLNGPINMSRAGELQRSLTRAIEGDANGNKANFICLWIDSSGGDLASCLHIASFIAEDIDASNVRIVAYVPHQARSGAVLAALACDEVVVGPNVVLGGDGAIAYDSRQVQDAVETLSTSLAKKMLRHWSIPAAMIDPTLEVAEYTLKTQPNTRAFFSERELAAQPDPLLWIKGNVVTRPGRPLEISSGKQAVEFLVADKIAADFNEFRTLYHLENEPTLLAPGWADQLIRALASPAWASLLLFIGFLGIWKELHTPGLGIGAIVAILCFALFFWSRFLGGTAGWLEAILIIGGIVLLALEIFVIPGFGICGIMGSLLLIGGFVLASQTFIIPRNSYQYSQLINSGFVLVISGGGTAAILATTAHWLHEANMPKDNAMVSQSEKLADYEYLRGRSGRTLTPLVPSGLAMFDGKRIDVSSEGEMLDADTPVTVVDIRGYRVIVRKTGETTADYCAANKN